MHADVSLPAGIKAEVGETEREDISYSVVADRGLGKGSTCTVLQRREGATTHQTPNGGDETEAKRNTAVAWIQFNISPQGTEDHPAQRNQPKKDIIQRARGPEFYTARYQTERPIHSQRCPSTWEALYIPRQLIHHTKASSPASMSGNTGAEG